MWEPQSVSIAKGGPPTALASVAMTDSSGLGATPNLDQWIAEVGEDKVLDAVRDARRAIKDGQIPGFTDKASLLDYIGRHQTA